MMQKWVEYVCRAAGDSCIWSTGHHYGDWLALDAGEGNYTGASRKEFIATAFYAHSAQLLAQAMDALDMDGAAYHRLFETIRAAHQNAFPDCRTQTECALALHFGLAAAPDRVAAQLAELVRSNGNRLTTGFVGTPYLLHALSKGGRLVLEHRYELVQSSRLRRGRRLAVRRGRRHPAGEAGV